MSHISSNFDMTADTLWVVWAHTSHVALAKGHTKDKITCYWILASEGEEGVREIQGPRGIPGRFIAAMPLSALRQVATLLGRTKASNRPSWLRKFWPTINGVRLLQLSNGCLEWQLSSNSPPKNSSILLKRRCKNIFDLLNRGEEIFNQRDYKQVIGDARPISDGHPSDWIMHKRNPAGMARVDAWLNSE